MLRYKFFANLRLRHAFLLREQGNYKDAATELKYAADVEKDGQACYVLATAYQYGGWGLDQDVDLEIKYYQMALDFGCEWSVFYLIENVDLCDQDWSSKTAALKKIATESNDSFVKLGWMIETRHMYHNDDSRTEKCIQASQLFNDELDKGNFLVLEHYHYFDDVTRLRALKLGSEIRDAESIYDRWLCRSAHIDHELPKEEYFDQEMMNGKIRRKLVNIAIKQRSIGMISDLQEEVDIFNQEKYEHQNLYYHHWRIKLLCKMAESQGFSKKAKIRGFYMNSEVVDTVAKMMELKNIYKEEYQWYNYTGMAMFLTGRSIDRKQMNPQPYVESCQKIYNSVMDKVRPAIYTWLMVVKRLSIVGLNKDISNKIAKMLWKSRKCPLEWRLTVDLPSSPPKPE